MLKDRIKFKSEIVQKFGVSRKTFNERYLDDLLKHIGYTREEWRSLHNRAFPLFLSVKVESFFKKWEKQL